MSNFKKGDRVQSKRLCSNNAKMITIEEGSIVTITSIGRKGLYLEEFQGWGYWDENDFRYPRVANTAITRKLYPHYKEDGELLICAEKNS